MILDFLVLIIFPAWCPQRLPSPAVPEFLCQWRMTEYQSKLEIIASQTTSVRRLKSTLRAAFWSFPSALDCAIVGAEFSLPARASGRTVDLMRQPLNLLIVEDSEDDLFLVARELERGGFDLSYERVETAAGFKAALAGRTWDLVIADYNLPVFSATEALRLLQASKIDLPFLIVSGAIGEEVAVGAMKVGAHDYILKNSLTRLVPAVERELRDARVRRERRLAQEAFTNLAAIVESSGDAIIGTSLDGRITSWNLGAERIFGYQADEAVGQPLNLLIPPERAGEEARFIERLKRGEIIEHFETVRVCRDGRRIDVSLTISPIRDQHGTVIGASKIARDITERRRTETALAALSKLGQNLAAA